METARSSTPRQECDSNGNLPLHCSSLGGDPCLTSLLLAAGADSEAPNTEGDRPLHLAAGAGNVGVLRVLLEVLPAPPYMPAHS